MLQDLARRVGLGIAGAILLGIGAGATLVAVTFAIYAALKPYVGAAGASGLTALAAAALTATCGLILLAIIKSPKTGRRHPREPLHRGLLPELGVLALGIIGDLAAGSRAKREQKARETKHRRR